jgi:hypothetical protein
MRQQAVQDEVTGVHQLGPTPMKHFRHLFFDFLCLKLVHPLGQLFQELLLALGFRPPALPSSRPSLPRALAFLSSLLIF